MLFGTRIIYQYILRWDTRAIIQIVITSRILWFLRANHYQVEKLFWCRKRLFAKKRKIENRKMMEKEIDDFYLWQSLSSFLSDYIVVNLFQNARRLFLASNKMESNNFVIYYWLIDEVSHKYKIYWKYN